MNLVPIRIEAGGSALLLMDFGGFQMRGKAPGACAANKMLRARFVRRIYVDPETVTTGKRNASEAPGRSEADLMIEPTH
ncbi:MAG: hypothetical protein SH809_02670 [Rhodothermales bacterium]|nr:hypothetical protein [Rhodothermales bacterium]